MGLIYFGIFNAQDLNYPVHSACRTTCLSTGMQRAFSELVRGRVASALHYNVYSVQLFLFFVEFFVQRILMTVLLKKYSLSTLARFDVISTSLFFLAAFYPFIINIFFVLKNCC